jgi:poly(3-hydroxybutyrate) depolymerase
MADFGYVFYPNECLVDGVSCKVHVVMHGCVQNEQAVFLGLVNYSGFNEYAVTNQLIIVYPQANAVFGKNLAGCWDVGIQAGSAENYATNEGTQPKAIKAMVDRLTSSRDIESYDYSKWNVLDRPTWW